MGFFKDTLGMNDRKAQLEDDDEAVLKKLENFFSTEYRTADREGIEGAISDFTLLQTKAGQAAKRHNTDRFAAMATATTEASTFLEASQPLADKTKAATNRAPGLDRYTSLLSGLAGDK